MHELGAGFPLPGSLGLCRAQHTDPAAEPEGWGSRIHLRSQFSVAKSVLGLSSVYRRPLTFELGAKTEASFTRVLQVPRSLLYKREVAHNMSCGTLTPGHGHA